MNEELDKRLSLESSKVPLQCGYRFFVRSQVWEVRAIDSNGDAALIKLVNPKDY